MTTLPTTSPPRPDADDATSRVPLPSAGRFSMDTATRALILIAAILAALLFILATAISEVM